MATPLAHLYPKALPRARGVRFIAILLRPFINWRARKYYSPDSTESKIETIRGMQIAVSPNVFSPTAFLTSGVLLKVIDKLAPAPGAHWLELGTGCGLAALYAAQRGASVIATDINPAAVACARANAVNLGLSNRLEMRQGDLFAPVRGERFDVILFHPPYFPGEQSPGFGEAWHFGDLPQRFSAELAEHLTPGGIVLLLLSTNGACDSYLVALEAEGFQFEVFHQIELFVERVVVYRVWEA